MHKPVHELLQTIHILLRPGVGGLTVDVEHPDWHFLAFGKLYKQRDDNLGLGRAVAGDVSWDLVDILYHHAVGMIEKWQTERRRMGSVDAEPEEHVHDRLPNCAD